MTIVFCPVFFFPYPPTQKGLAPLLNSLEFFGVFQSRLPHRNSVQTMTIASSAPPITVKLVVKL